MPLTSTSTPVQTFQFTGPSSPASVTQTGYLQLSNWVFVPNTAASIIRQYHVTKTGPLLECPPIPASQPDDGPLKAFFVEGQYLNPNSTVMYVANALSGPVTTYSRNTSLHRPCLGFDVVSSINPSSAGGATQITDLQGYGEPRGRIVLGVTNPASEADSIVGLDDGEMPGRQGALQVMCQSSSYGQSPVFDINAEYVAIADRVQSTIAIVPMEFSGTSSNWSFGPAVISQIQVGEPGTPGDLGNTGLSSIQWLPGIATF